MRAKKKASVWFWSAWCSWVACGFFGDRECAVHEVGGRSGGWREHEGAMLVEEIRMRSSTALAVQVDDISSGHAVRTLSVNGSSAEKMSMAEECKRRLIKSVRIYRDDNS